MIRFKKFFMMIIGLFVVPAFACHESARERLSRHAMSPIIHLSARSGVDKIEIFEEAVKHFNYDIDWQLKEKYNQNTPLHMAIEGCRVNIVKCLLKLGARTDLCNKSGQRALEHAINWKKKTQDLRDELALPGYVDAFKDELVKLNQIIAILEEDRRWHGIRVAWVAGVYQVSGQLGE